MCRKALGLLSAGALWVLGCGTDEAPLAEPVAKTVGPSGGVVSLTRPNGGRNGTEEEKLVSLEVPPDAIEGDPIEVTIEPLPPDAVLPDESTAGATTVVHGLVVEIGPSGTVFNKPVRLLFAVDPALVKAAAGSLRVATVVDDAWAPLSEPMADPNSGTVSGTTTHLSPFGVIEVDCDRDSDCRDDDACTADSCSAEGRCVFSFEAGSRPCYSGPPGTDGVGACRAGTRSCVSGLADTCSGEVVPTSELCNGLDDDCDGEVDDGACGGADAGLVDAGLPDAGPSDAGVADAGVADAGVADAGVADAGVADAGVADAGVADAGVADAGVADAGVTDAGVADAGVADAGAADAGAADAGAPDAGVADAGTADAGAADAGVADAGAEGGTSDAAADLRPDIPCVAQPELCNGLDDDCDGQIDEGIASVPCGSDIGECQSGDTTCSNGKLVCAGEIGPADEICDGLDNNCNSEVDESCCTPLTCDDLGAFGDSGDPCGTLSDGCSGQVSCICNTPFVCVGGYCASL